MIWIYVIACIMLVGGIAITRIAKDPVSAYVGITFTVIGFCLWFFIVVYDLTTRSFI